MKFEAGITHFKMNIAAEPDTKSVNKAGNVTWTRRGLQILVMGGGVAKLPLLPRVTIETLGFQYAWDQGWAFGLDAAVEIGGGNLGAKVVVMQGANWTGPAIELRLDTRPMLKDNTTSAGNVNLGVMLEDVFGDFGDADKLIPSIKAGAKIEVFIFAGKEYPSTWKPTYGTVGNTTSNQWKVKFPKLAVVSA